MYQLAIPPTHPLSPHPRQHMLSPEFLNLAILTGERWNLRVVLICISLMIKDTEHFSGASQPFCIPQLKILCLALHLIFKWCYLNFWSPALSSLYILDISPLLDLGLVKNLSQSIGGPFVLLTVSFVLQKLCNLIRSHLSILILQHKPLVFCLGISLCARILEAFPQFLLYKF